MQNLVCFRFCLFLQHGYRIYNVFAMGTKSLLQIFQRVQLPSGQNHIYLHMLIRVLTGYLATIFAVSSIASKDSVHKKILVLTITPKSRAKVCAQWSR